MKGQWRYLRSGYGSRNADFDIVNASGGRIASTPYEDKARMIAAVPDLLKALKELVARCDGAEGVRADGSNIQTIQAHAAIAKAEGAQ